METQNRQCGRCGSSFQTVDGVVLSVQSEEQLDMVRSGSPEVRYLPFQWQQSGICIRCHRHEATANMTDDFKVQTLSS